MQDSRAWLRASAGHGLHLSRPHAGRHIGRARLARHRIRGGRSMSWFVLGALILLAFGFSTRAHAQDLSAFYAQTCPEGTATSWCPPLLLKEGWKLRYVSESP